MRLTGGYTVFAQVIDGMDVVDKIASAKVDKDDIPVKNIVIKSIKITQYKEGINDSGRFDICQKRHTADHSRIRSGYEQNARCSDYV